MGEAVSGIYTRHRAPAPLSRWSMITGWSVKGSIAGRKSSG